MKRVAALLVTMLAFGLDGREPEKTLQIDEIMPLLADLAARGGYGVRDTEQAAFIVRDDDGDARCILWPSTGAFQKAAVRTELPAGLIAIAHTHPRCCRELSAHDKREARRLAVPIIAVSMGTLNSVDGRGKPDESRYGLAWSRFADPAKTCAPTGK